ncbi:MAG: DoxX family membrane protein [Salinibacterium sp.]|nr:DoxX family membrane protein [Salinibacterium sp.]
MPASVIDIIQLIVLVGLVVLFVGMGLNHFRPRPAKIMATMIPPLLRFDGPLRPIVLVYLTGACEVLGGIGLAVPLTRPLAAIALALFLVAVFPANVHASQHPETFRSLSIPFWPRLAGQVALIAVIVWIGFF